MALKTRLDPISRDVEVMLADMQEVEGAEILAAFAAQEIDEAKQHNRQILGRDPPVDIFVDGQQGASLAAVRSNSVIVAEFELVSEVLAWIEAQLVQHSPVKSGLYQKSHIVLADGSQIEPDIQVLLAEEYVFINTVPYARKIERGSSSQAPDGVYQAVAVLARRRYGNIASINFSYRTVIGGSLISGHAGNRSSDRNPAIIVRPKES